MWPNPEDTVEFVTFTEEILNGRLYSFVRWMVARAVALVASVASTLVAVK